MVRYIVGIVSPKFHEKNLKGIASFLIIFLILIINTQAQFDSSSMRKYYDIKSCKIVYNFSNGLQKGEKTIVFDFWGNYEKAIVHSRLVNESMGGDSVISKLVTKGTNMMYLKTPKVIYEINMDDNIGIKQDRSSFEFSSDFLDQKKKKIGIDTILGKPCEIIEVAGAIKIWFWNKIALKKQLSQKVDGITVEEYAIKVDEQYSVRPNQFKPGT